MMDGDLKCRMPQETVDVAEADATEESATYKAYIPLGVVIIIVSVILTGINCNIIQSMLEGSHRALPGSQLNKIMVILLMFSIGFFFMAVAQAAKLIYDQLNISDKVNSSAEVTADNAVQYLLFGILICSIYLIIFTEKSWLLSLARIIF